jgi:ABC-type thiamine transport system ATPase subunit
MAQENLAGVRIVKAYGRRRAGRALPGALRGLPRAQHAARPRLRALPPAAGLFSAGWRWSLVLLVGGRAVMRGRDHRRRLRRLHPLPGDADLADDRARLGGQPLPARRRLDGPHQPVLGPSHPPSPTPPSRSRPRRSAARSSSATSPSAIPAPSATGAARRLLPRSRRATLAVVGRHRLREVDAGEPAGPAVRPDRRRDPAGRRPAPPAPAGAAPRAIGIVPQDAFLFSDTIRENLALGIDEDPDEARGCGSGRARRAARRDGRRLPAGYDTLLGERGVNLSGGPEAAGHARARHRPRPRVLVLDDALSAVDTHTEPRSCRAARGLRERTSVVVSHRVSAVMDADQILVLDDGRVVERGTHRELLGTRRDCTPRSSAGSCSPKISGEGVLAGDPNRERSRLCTPRRLPLSDGRMIELRLLTPRRRGRGASACERAPRGEGFRVARRAEDGTVRRRLPRRGPPLRRRGRRGSRSWSSRCASSATSTSPSRSSWRTSRTSCARRSPPSSPTARCCATGCSARSTRGSARRSSRSSARAGSSSR